MFFPGSFIRPYGFKPHVGPADDQDPMHMVWHDDVGIQPGVAGVIWNGDPTSLGDYTDWGQPHFPGNNFAEKGSRSLVQMVTK